MPGDFLDEMIAKPVKRNSEFPKLIEAARRRRESLSALADQREHASADHRGGDGDPALRSGLRLSKHHPEVPRVE